MTFSSGPCAGGTNFTQLIYCWAQFCFLAQTLKKREREREINGHRLQLSAHLLSSLNEVRGGAAVYFFKAGDNSGNSCNRGEAQLVPVNPVGRVVLKHIRTGLEVSDVHYRAEALSSASVLAAIKAALWRRDRLVNDNGRTRWVEWKLFHCLDLHHLSPGTCIPLDRSGHTHTSEKTNAQGSCEYYNIR